MKAKLLVNKDSVCIFRLNVVLSIVGASKCSFLLNTLIFQSKRSCCPKVDAIKGATADIVSHSFANVIFIFALYLYPM